MPPPIRVMVVDDSALARSLLRSYYEADGGFQVIAEAGNGRDAIRLVRELRPDLVTMDLEMPVMGGLEAIQEIMSFRPVPVLVVSSVADAGRAYAAMELGAVDVTVKPSPAAEEVASFLEKSRLVAGVSVVSHIRPKRTAPPPEPPRPAPHAPAGGPVFAIAASTGGPQALARLLAALPAGFAAPVLIAQHISDGFAAGMVEWLATLARLPVRLAAGGETLLPGVVLVSPSEADMTISADRVVLRQRGERDIYRPSCDQLLASLAAAYGRRAVGIILTGMGSDGVRGLDAIRRGGGRTIAQDEASSVIFGMNRAAIERGLADRVLPLDDIAAAMQDMARPPRPEGRA